MTFAAPHRLRMVAFALTVCPVPALAEAGPAGRTWTDPPAREAGGGREEALKPPEAVQAVPAAPSPAPKPTHAAVRAAKVRVAKTRIAKVRVAETAIARPAPRAKVASRSVAPRAAGQDFAVRHGTGFRHAPDFRSAPGFRVVTVRPPFHAPPPFAGYGYIVEAAPARAPFYDDVRAAQIRQAEAAGYRVVRSRAPAFPDGGRPRVYRFFDPDGDD